MRRGCIGLAAGAAFSLISVPAIAQDLGAGSPVGGSGGDALAYLIAVPQPVYERPAASSPLITTLKPLGIVRIARQDGAWLLVERVPEKDGVPDHDHSAVVGWIAAKTENLLEDPFDLSWARLSTLQSEALGATRWPFAIKLAIMRKQDPKIGYTSLQVRLSKGKPISIGTEETEKAKTETLVYPGVVYTLVNDRVTKITKVE